MRTLKNFLSGTSVRNFKRFTGTILMVMLVGMMCGCDDSDPTPNPGDPISGTWTGQQRGTESDGTRYVFDVTITLNDRGSGTYQEVDTYTYNGETETKTITGTVTYTTANSTSGTMTIKVGRETKTLDFQLIGNSTLKLYGTDDEGDYITFTLSKEQTPSIAGTWKAKESGTEEDGTSYVFEITLTLDNNGTGTYREVDTYTYRGKTETETITGTVTYSWTNSTSGTMIINVDGERQYLDLDFTYQGSTLYLHGENFDGDTVSIKLTR